jgi:hypothetical protein
MIEGGWAYIWPAYAVGAFAFGALTIAVVLRLRHWASEARKLEKKP